MIGQPPDATQQLDRATLQQLLPHQGLMCLLDSVVRWDADAIHCRSRSHARVDNPLREPRGLRTVHLCEYGAQAMAVHGGLLARRDGTHARPGMLVSLRGVRLHQPWIVDLAGEIDVHAERLLGGADSWQYAFRVLHEGILLAEGRAAVMLAQAPAATEPD